MNFRLPQIAVYWAPQAVNAFGRAGFAQPVEVACRWEDGNVETIDGQGETVLATATVFMERDVHVGGMLMLGRLQDLGSSFPPDVRSDRRTHEIVNFGSVPSLRATQSLRTARLK